MNQRIFNLLWLSALLLAGCQTASQDILETAPVPSFVTENITKSPNDESGYRYLRLANSLRVLLISDKEADKSAAALTVFRGSFDDPEAHLGLAHFLEHMLFIGTRKYPEPDGYFKYVQAHGGNSNAYTSTDHTNYFFDIKPDAFREGLDRFAQFFISPLFSRDYVAREKNAVHSEYQMQIKQDNWRAWSVQKVAINPEHPFAKFNIGTLETLSGDVHAALLDFFEENYSADQMSLVVLTPDSLDEMDAYVSSLFSGIRNNNLKDLVRKGDLVTSGSLPAVLAHDNIKNEHNLSFNFPIPSTRNLYRKKPMDYIASLVGHEGEGSLHKLLVEKGWITSLSAGTSDVDDGSSVFSVNIQLTEQGLDHKPEITGYLFAYLDMLKSSPVEVRLYEEQARVAELGFRFAEKSPAIATVQRLAPGLALYPPEDSLVAPWLMEEFDAELIRSFLTELHQGNVLQTFSSPGYEGKSTERWFGVSYDLAREPLEIADVEADAFHLPEINPFLPESLALLEDDPDPPELAVAATGLEIYMDRDVEFRVPRAVTHVSLRTDGGFSRIEDMVNARLYARLVEDDLTTLAYPALLAGLSYDLAVPPKGFRLSVSGYEDKQLSLLEEALVKLKQLEMDPARFAVLKQEFIRDLENAKRERLYHQAYRRLEDELISTHWTEEKMLLPLHEITLQSLTSWRDAVLGRVSVQALMLGNVDQSDGLRLQQLLTRHLVLADLDIAEPTVAQVVGTNSLPLVVDQDDAAMLLYVQTDSDTLLDRARSAFLTHLVAPGFFATLRTEQQLGYAVFATNATFRERGGIGFIVQSPVAGPDVLRDRALEYMAGQREVFSEMSQEEFDANKEGLITRLTAKDNGLWPRAIRFWSDLDRGITSFDSNMQLARTVDALSLGDMTTYLEEVNRKLDNQYLMVYSEGKFAATR